MSAITLHGRSKEQRYTKLADWDYIGQCRNTVSVPVFGNGDVMNYEVRNIFIFTFNIQGHKMTLYIDNILP